MRPYLLLAIAVGLLAAGTVATLSEDAADIPPMARKVKGFDLKLLEPVDGVTFRQIGEASYLFTVNADAPDVDARILARLHLDKARLEKAQKVFDDRMAADRTSTMTVLFGAYASEMAEGRYAAYGRDVAISVLDGTPLREPEPMTQEKFELIRSYYGRKEPTAGTKFSDLDKVLAPMGLTFNDFQILSSWFGRRFALEDDRPDADISEPVVAPTPPAQPRPDLGGLWRLTWTLLRRADGGMEKVPQTRDICLKLDMKAADLPIMPKPDGSKCALGVTSFYATGIGFSANCDHGDYAVQWSLDLQPPEGGLAARPQAPWTGEMQFGMQNEILGNMAPNATTSIVAERIGNCP